ncbi:MAG: type III-A CRISPR-associated RAMP protein Csm3, partial [bacterium]
MEIGGNDNPIIKNPVTNDPYIPGSSLKGKMRSLMEWKLGMVTPKGDVHNCGRPDCQVCRIFGTSNSKDGDGAGPTRLVVRDAHINHKWRMEMLEKDLLITEEKHENSINRITAVANPRPIERVVPSAEFDLEMTYKIMDMGDGGKADEDNFQIVLDALKAVENDALGGAGSRGCGKVKFELEVDGEKINL